jgi:Rrf2 family protein
MVLSQKCQYAVRAVFELAKRYDSGLVPAARVAECQCIPVRFLENILSELRQAGVVESVRGKEGGYRLGRAPREVTVGEVIRLVQGPLATVECGGRGETIGSPGRECPLRRGCVLLPMWDRAHHAMMDVFESTTFRDLVEDEQATSERKVIDYAI